MRKVIVKPSALAGRPGASDSGTSMSEWVLEFGTHVLGVADAEVRKLRHDP